MYGNLKAFAGQDAFNEYADHLRTFGEPMLPYGGLLWIMRVGLIVALVVHVLRAPSRCGARAARRAPQKYAVKKNVALVDLLAHHALGRRTLLLFLVWHLLNFTIVKVNPSPAARPTTPTTCSSTPSRCGG